MHNLMKHQGNVSDFAYLRNAELMAAFRKVLDEKQFFDINKDFEQVVNQPCSRFWTSEERATNVVAAIMRGQPIIHTMRPTKQEMFLEIYHRVMALRKERPNTQLFDIVFEVVNSPAPKFYMHPRYARKVIYLIKQGKYKAQ